MIDFSKFRTAITKIWKDPVWSKVISVGIVSGGIALWAKFSNYTFNYIYRLIIDILSYNIPLYFVLSLAGVYVLFKVLFKTFLSKSDPIGNEIIGDYKYQELFIILSKQNVDVLNYMCPPSNKPIPDNILALFNYYFTDLNEGIFQSDVGDEELAFLYNYLAPLLCNYGLMERSLFYNIRRNVNDVEYKATSAGKKFHSLVQKTFHLNSKI